MTGSIFKRCGCTEVVDGRRRKLSSRCPKLRRADGTWNPRHGNWTYTVSLSAKNGARQQVTRGGFTSQTEAQRALNDALNQLRRGVTSNNLTVGEYLAEWLSAKSDIRRSTHRAYRLHLEGHLVPTLGHLRLSELRVGHVAEMLNDLPASNATRQRIRATLRSALSDAVRQGLVLVNVASLVKLPSGKRPKALVWTDEHVTRWQAAVAELNAARDGTDSTPEQLAELENAAVPPAP